MFKYLSSENLAIYQNNSFPRELQSSLYLFMYDKIYFLPSVIVSVDYT